DRDTPALFAASGLYDHLAVLVEKFLQCSFSRLCGYLIWHGQTGLADNAPCHGFVVANRHSNAGCHFRKALATVNGTSTVRKAKKSTFRVGHFHLYATTHRFIDNDARIGIERLKTIKLRSEEFLIDSVFAFYSKKRHA